MPRPQALAICARDRAWVLRITSHDQASQHASMTATRSGHSAGRPARRLDSEGGAHLIGDAPAVSSRSFDERWCSSARSRPTAMIAPACSYRSSRALTSPAMRACTSPSIDAEISGSTFEAKRWSVPAAGDWPGATPRYRSATRPGSVDREPGGSECPISPISHIATSVLSVEESAESDETSPGAFDSKGALTSRWLPDGPLWSRA